MIYITLTHGNLFTQYPYFTPVMNSSRNCRGWQELLHHQWLLHGWRRAGSCGGCWCGGSNHVELQNRFLVLVNDDHSADDIIWYWLVVSNIFYFHPYLGKISDLTNIFQMGWNHQLDMILCHLRWWLRFFREEIQPVLNDMEVSENNGTPKSSILIGFSIVNHPFGVPLFLETPMYSQSFSCNPWMVYPTLLCRGFWCLRRWPFEIFGRHTLIYQERTHFCRETLEFIQHLSPRHTYWRVFLKEMVSMNIHELSCDSWSKILLREEIWRINLEWQSP